MVDPMSSRETGVQGRQGHIESRMAIPATEMAIPNVVDALWADEVFATVTLPEIC